MTQPTLEEVTKENTMLKRILKDITYLDNEEGGIVTSSYLEYVNLAKNHPELIAILKEKQPE